MWGLKVVHSKQVFHFNCVRFNEVPLYVFTGFLVLFYWNTLLSILTLSTPPIYKQNVCINI